MNKSFHISNTNWLRKVWYTGSIYILCTLFSANVNAAGPSLGMNLNEVTAWGPEYFFTNLAHHSRGWFPINVAPVWQGWYGSDNLTPDKYLKPGESGRLCIFWDAPANTIAPGEYIFQYSGTATVALNTNYNGGGTFTVVSNVPGKLTINMSNLSGKIFLYIDVTNNSATDPIKNIFFAEKARENSTDVYRPEFLSQYSMLKSFRFMDWMHTNGSTTTTWAEYTPDNALIQTGKVSFGNMIALANKANADAWFCVPMLANDDFVRQMAQKIRDNLSQNLMAYIELSNEVWNGQFASHTQAANLARELGVSNTGKNWEDAPAYVGYRTAQIEKIFKEEFAKSSTAPALTVLIAWQSVNSWHFENFIMPNYRKVLGATASPKAVAIAPYFGNGLGSIENEAVVQGWTLDQLFEQLMTGKHTATLPSKGSVTIDEAIATVKSYKTVLAKYNIPTLVAYEGGQHLSGVAKVADNQTITNLFIAANRDRRMYDAYIKYLDGWKAEGGDLFEVFASTGNFSKWGSWGWKELPAETRAQAPKYDAILTWNGTNTPEKQPVLTSTQNKILGESIIAYPNPVEDILYIESKTEKNNILIFNSTGKMVAKSMTRSVNMSELPNGLYIADVNGKRIKISKN